jgi:hypothetical protein
MDGMCSDLSFFSHTKQNVLFPDSTIANDTCKRTKTGDFEDIFLLITNW